MAKSELKLSINALNIDLIKNLIEAIEKHYDDMPSDLKEIIRQADETGLRDYTHDDLYLYMCKNNIDYSNIEVSHKEVTKVNKHLKKIYYADGTSEYSNSFTIKHKDVLIYGW